MIPFLMFAYFANAQPNIIPDIFTATSTVNNCSFINVTVDERNTGNANAGANYIKLYFSNNAQLGDADDVYVGQIYINQGPVAGGYSPLYQQMFLVPGNVSIGTKYFYFWLDATNLINEGSAANENDNFCSVQVQVTPSSVSVPVAEFGSTSCPGSSTGTIVPLSWSGSNSSYTINVSKYPYGTTPFNNIIYTASCINGSSLQVSDPDIIPGLLYRWNMSGFNEPFCNSCQSGTSNTKYFYIPPAISPAGSQTVCNGQSVTFSTPNLSSLINAPGILSYQWLQNGNPISGATGTIYNATASGNYSVQLNYSGSSNCGSASVQSSSVAVNVQASPLSQANSINFSSVGANSMVLNWNNGDGTSRIVVAKTNNPITGTPVNGTSYTANSNFGNGSTIASGEYVVYNGTGSSVTVNNLSLNTAYYFRVFEYRCNSPQYLTTAATGNPSSQQTTSGLCSTPNIQASNIAFSTVGTNAMTLNWANGNGTNRIVIAKANGSITGMPVNGATYSASAVFGNGNTLNTGEYVVYSGTGSSVTVSGLTENITYYFRVYEYSCSPTLFLTSTSSGNPASQATSLPVSNSITGTVYDFSKTNASTNLFSGAAVELLNSSGNIISTVNTASNGNFQFQNLSGSNYQIRVSSGSGAGFVSGTTSGINPGTNFSVIKLPYTLHLETQNSNSSLGSHTFGYTIGYVFTLPVPTTAFNTSLAANYLQSALSSFNTNVDAKIQAMQRMLALFNTMKVVGDNGADMIQKTNEEIINGVMMFLSIGEFLKKFNTLKYSGGVNFINRIRYAVEEEVLNMKMIILKNTLKAGISFVNNRDLKERMNGIIDGSFAIIQKHIESADANEFNDGVRQEILNEIVTALVTPLIYRRYFINPIQANLNQAVSDISLLNYTNSTPASVLSLNEILTNSNLSYSSHSYNLAFYSSLAEGLSSGAQLYAYGKLLMTNPVFITATGFSSVLLGLASFGSEAKSIHSGLMGVLAQKEYAYSACSAATNRLLSINGYRMFNDAVFNDSLHFLYLKENEAVSKMQNENYSIESLIEYIKIDSTLARKTDNLIVRLNNQFAAQGDSLALDSFYHYLAVSNSNINLRSNFSWLAASKLAGITDPELNDSLSFYSGTVKINNIIADSILNEAAVSSSNKLSPSYFSIEKILYSNTRDTGQTIPVTVITKLHSDTVMTGQLKLSGFSDDLDSLSKVYYPNINDTTVFIVNGGSSDSTLILRMAVSAPEAIGASQNIMIYVQSQHDSISLIGSPLLCTVDSAILTADPPPNYIVKWKEENLNSIVGIGDSLIIHSGFPGIFRAIYFDTITAKSYHSPNSIEITNPIPSLGADKTVSVICSGETANISNLYNSSGFTTEWDIPNPAAAPLGNHRLIVTNSYGCRDTATIDVKQNIQVWLGEVSDDWHDSLNWSNNSIPNDSTHAIIGPALHPCIVKMADAAVASVQIRPGGIFNVNTNRRSVINAYCDPLPEVGNVPSIVSSVISNVSVINATGGGIINNDGGTQITARGVCWNTTSNPTVKDRKTTNGNGVGSFTSTLTGLSASTTYYLRAYATNSAGTNYGNSISFTTPPPPVYDIDGNIYPVVNICNKQWTAKSLEVTHYRNGDTIPQVQDPVTWSNLTTGAWCYYQNNTSNGPVYGKLYNWYAVNDPRGLAPAGWHIPSNSEWQSLADTCLGGFATAAGKIKTTGTLQAGTGLWGGSFNNATNSSGFSGVPSGSCFINGTFANLSGAAFWWSATQSNINNAMYYEADQETEELFSSVYSKKLGISVRCVKN